MKQDDQWLVKVKSIGDYSNVVERHLDIFNVAGSTYLFFE